MIDANERGTPRAEGLAKVASDDARFDLAGYYNLPVDACFSLSLGGGTEQTFYEPSGALGLNVELKGPGGLHIFSSHRPPVQPDPRHA
jgi:hypothetical protein